MSYLDAWHAMPAHDAAEAVLPCCGSHAWAHGLAARRPLGTLPELLAASDAAWWSLCEADWNEAFESHPRIGERAAHGTTTGTSLGWSANEQGTALHDDVDMQAKLAAGNRAYEVKFGRIFIVCASGKTPHEMLAILDRRMRNTQETELQAAAEQQREITHIRLRKWLAAHEEQTVA